MKINARICGVFVLLAASIFISGCLEEQGSLSDPDGQIVVIGNGADQKIDWTRALVVDVAKDSATQVQSLIAEDKNLVPVQDRLKDLTPLKDSSSSVMRLDWMTEAAQEKTALIKLSSSRYLNSVSITAFESLGESDAECSVVQAGPGGVSCRTDLSKFEISRDNTPVLSPKGHFLFIDKKNTLWISDHLDHSDLIAQDVKNFVFNQDVGLFFRGIEGAWFFLTTTEIDQRIPGEKIEAKKISRDGLLYMTSDKNIYLFGSDFMRSSQSNKAFEVRKFNQKTFEFDPIKKFNSSLNIISLQEDLGVGVQNDKLYVFSNIVNSSSVSRRALVQISTEGIAEVPIKGSQLNQIRLQVGKHLVWVNERDQASRRLAGEVCSEVASSDSSRVHLQCRTLIVPEFVQVVASTLEEDLLVLGLKRESPSSLNQKYLSPSMESENEVVVVESRFSKPNFGTIIKSWSLDQIVKDLRFFALRSADAKTDSQQEQSSPEPVDKAQSLQKLD